MVEAAADLKRGHRVGRVLDEDAVEHAAAERHDQERQRGGQADDADAADDRAVVAEVPEVEADVGEFRHKQQVDEGQGGRRLADDRRQGGAGDAHAEGEDEQRVEGDVQHGGGALDDHGRFHVALAREDRPKEDGQDHEGIAAGPARGSSSRPGVRVRPARRARGAGECRRRARNRSSVRQPGRRSGPSARRRGRPAPGRGAPMACAITAVMPVPRPKVTPIARNTSGMLKARAVSASGLTRPTKNMSTIM